MLKAQQICRSTRVDFGELYDKDNLIPCKNLEQKLNSQNLFA